MNKKTAEELKTRVRRIATEALSRCRDDEAQTPVLDAESKALEAIDDLVLQKDLCGRIFGRLKVLRALSSRGKDGCQLWECKCECGKRTKVNTLSLTSGNTRSCGCLQMESRGKHQLKDLRGLQFGKLKALRPVKARNNRKAGWRCRCACGTELTCTTNSLTSGHTKSCGCLITAVLKKRNAKMKGSRHPFWDPNLTEEDRSRRRLSTPISVSIARINKKVRKRDGNICFLCRKRKEQLQVHHLISWASSRTLRFRPKNLITLCRTCHLDFHAMHGLDAGLDEFIDYCVGADEEENTI